MEQEECKLTIEEMQQGLQNLLAMREECRREVSTYTKQIIEMRKQLYEETQCQIAHLLPLKCEAFTRYVHFKGGKYCQHQCPFAAHHSVNGKSYCMRHADKIRQGISFEHGTQEELAIAWEKHKHYYPTSTSSNRKGP